VDKSDDVTIGISNGVKNPATKIIPAVTNFPFGGRLSVLLFFSFIIIKTKKMNCLFIKPVGIIIRNNNGL
jgi:hypothetical protein